MFYQYFRPSNYICNVFGLSRHSITAEGTLIRSNLFNKLWCVVVAALFIASFCFSLKLTEFKFKENLETISDINDLVVSIIIMLVNVSNSGQESSNLCNTFNIIFKDFNFDSHIPKLFALKMYFWFSIPTIMFVILIIMEILSKNLPYDLLIRLPVYLSAIYLFMHLYVILALVKILNIKLSRTIIGENKTACYEDSATISSAKYVLNPSIKFIDFTHRGHFDMKLLCKIYDNLSTSIHLLEQNHGFEVLLLVWLMFTCGVVGMTLIACKQVTIMWLVCMKSILPFLWSFIGCCIAEKLRTEVDQTMTLIIKSLIDYRCVPAMKPDLEMFKQLVSNDKLEFNACNLFHLSYAMILGAILNVITYSIILIQMFLT